MPQESDRIRFTGAVSDGEHVSNQTMDITIRAGELEWTSDPLVNGLFVIALKSHDPAVIRFFLRAYVAMQNRDAELRRWPECQRRRERRRENAKRRTPTANCPNCQASGEVWIQDRMVTCPRCNGAGVIH